MNLTDKNVIYIGGFGGIGQKCVLELLSRNLKNLAIFDLKENELFLQQLQQSFNGTNVFYIKLDITDKKEIEAAYKEAIDRMGHIDVMINGCGLMNDKYIDLTVQINLLGLINSTLVAITHMNKSSGGRGGLIINISSVVGLEPNGMFAVYSATKCGVTAFTRSLANPVYYAHTGISFITICPGFTDTTLLDSPHGKETFDFAQPITERFIRAKRQSAEVCATNLVKAIELAKNGSCWILDLGQMKEVEFPLFWKPEFNA